MHVYSSPAVLSITSLHRWPSWNRFARQVVYSQRRIGDSICSCPNQLDPLTCIGQAIVSMVDQHSGTLLTQLERSIIETIEADVETADAIVDIDTSSSMLDDDGEALSASPSPLLRFVGGKRYPYGKTVANSSTVSLAPPPKSSPHSAPSRPRASSEVSVSSTLLTFTFKEPPLC